VLEFVEYGDPGGLPVIFQPGTPATARTGELVADVAVRLGVRLIAVNRPGYGATPTTPPGLASVAGQVGLLADELDLDRFGVWGLSGGGPYALAQAATTPDRVTRVVVSAGGAPGGPVQEVGELVAEADELATHFGALDATTFVAQRPLHERFFRDHPEYVDAFLADIRGALTRQDGHVRDNLSWQGDWDFSLADVAAPVDLVYGDADQMVVLDNGQRLSDAIPHAHLHVLPDAGHGYATFGSADLALGLFGAGKRDSMPGA
jgi:pimeloyl-ACP methyl ester carboxylesterase